MNYSKKKEDTKSNLNLQIIYLLKTVIGMTLSFRCCISFQIKQTYNLNILLMFDIYKYNSSRRILLNIDFFLVS